MKKNVFLLSVAALLGLCLAPHAVPQAATCGDPAARNLLASSYMDALLNPSKAEDTDFFTRSGGVPNIMFLVDTSTSMRRLPPNGPSLPDLDPAIDVTSFPGVTLADPADGTQQSAAFSSPLRIVGCGEDTDTVGTSFPELMKLVNAIGARRFHPPCGATMVALNNQPYGGDGVHYAAEMAVCPYYGHPSGGKEGFDPDSYDGINQASNKFFTETLVFHDTLGSRDLLDSVNFPGSLTTFGHNFGDSWTGQTLAPYVGNNPKSIDEFCNAQGTAPQGTSNQSAICKSCLKNRGWFYDGVKLTSGTETYPSLWYTGNYLNFYPPKFLVTKKIVKDVMSAQTRMRMGVVGLDAAGASVKASGPNANWLDLSPTCGQLDDTSNWDASRGSFNTKVGALTFGNTTKPLAGALFDVGRFYHSPWLTWFGTQWEDATKESDGTATTGNQFAICFSCQASTVVLITDGVPSPADGDALPPNGIPTTAMSGKYAGDPATGIRGIDSNVCPTCAEFSGYKDHLPQVAWYMHNMDLRDNSETTKDCLTNGGKQVLDVYTVGFSASQEASTILHNTAEAGGGISVDARDPSSLKSGLKTVVDEINTRSTSFSVATVSTLQTTVGRSVIVPRFAPGKTAHWKGQLFRFDLYSEFVNACDPKSDGTGVGDYDCDGSCTSAFLEDKRDTDGGPPSFITEDGNGQFVRTDPAKPECSVAPKCKTIASKSCGNPGNADAVPFWDAGAKLAEKSWQLRNVWTVVDTDGNGVIDEFDDMVPLANGTDASDEAATKIAPYLGLGGSRCTDLGAKLRGKGWTSAARSVEGSPTACAKMFIRYLLGADLFNETAHRTGYPPTNPQDIWDRDYKLGDIFHSSPVVMEAPFPADGILCPNGLANQCLQSLWLTQTKDGRTAYDGYAKSTQAIPGLPKGLQNRRKVVLVGANDGLLHAFNGGEWIGNTASPGVHNSAADDPYTTSVDESLPPFNGYYSRGDAGELWAFLPPDMLAKIPMLTGTEHQLFVDGTAMVRDVWVDGTNNGIGGGSPDGKKQASEFHTVAIVGERRGGTHYFGLDLTSATEFDTHPKFLWIYPQPNSQETLDFGETYDDFLPGAPPVGPVALKVSTAIAGVTPVMTVGVSSPTPYEERWVAFLNGGFDPQYLRGRGVHMVDVWTGKELFDFSYPRDGAATDPADPRLALRFPIASVVGMTPWGPNARRQSGEHNDYLFDTATFGDTGGQMWVVRFHEPGVLETLNGQERVTNWYGARVFQMGGSGSCTMCGDQPFFYLTANVPLPTNGAYRVFAGTGDRYNLLDKNGGTCGPDNIRACVLRGCTATLSTSGNVLQAGGDQYPLGKAGRGFTQGACSAGSFTASAPDNGAVATCGVEGKVNVAISCANGTITTTKDIQVVCTPQVNGYSCTSAADNQGAKLDSLSTPISLGNWYLSLLVFEETGDRAIFSDLGGAKRYDALRTQLSQTDRTTSTSTAGLVRISASAANPSPLADANSKGWAMYYDHTSDGTITVEDHTFLVSWMDERTSTGSAVFDDIFWNSVQPTQGTTRVNNPSCTVAQCTEADRRIGYHYGANVETGGLPKRLVDSTGAVTRALKSTLLVPTQGDQPTVFVNQKGQIAVGLTAVNPEKGATNVGMGDPVDPAMDLGWVEVSEPLHACRHPNGTAAPVCQ